jgi:hypothetical protein
VTEPRPAPDGGPRGRSRGELRPVGEVQRRAIEDAGRVVEDLLDAVESSIMRSRAGRGGDGGPAAPGLAEIRADVGRAVDLYADLFQRTVDAYVALAESAERRAGDGPPAPPDALILEVAAGAVAEGTVWLHNTREVAVAPQVVRPTALTAHHGGLIAPSQVTVDPTPLPSVPAGGSVAAVVRVDAMGALPGRYHGHLLGEPATLAVRLDVVG